MEIPVQRSYVVRKNKARFYSQELAKRSRLRDGTVENINIFVIDELGLDCHPMKRDRGTDDCEKLKGLRVKDSTT
jgi:hypothetical protein